MMLVHFYNHQPRPSRGRSGSVRQIHISDLKSEVKLRPIKNEVDVQNYCALSDFLSLYPIHIAFY